MPPTIIANGAASSSNTQSVTIAALNTTGATFLVAVLAQSQGAVKGTMSDAKGNTWTEVTAFGVTGGPLLGMYYVAAPVVGTGHTVTYTGVTTNTFPAIAVAAFSEVLLVSPFDAHVGNGSAAAVTSILTTSLTPSTSGSLLLSATAFDTVSTVSINLGFAMTNQLPLVGGQAYGVALASLIQGAAAAINPTWSYSPASHPVVMLAAFKAGVAVPKSSPFLRRPWRFVRRRT